MTKLFTAGKDVTMTSVEGVVYKVVNGFVEVPWEAAKILMDGHGFTDKLPGEIKNEITQSKVLPKTSLSIPMPTVATPKKG